MDKKKKIDFSLIILLLLLLICIYFVIQVTFLGQGYVNVFGYTIFHVVTGSMEPEISINDLVIVKLNDEYNVGDIITYKYEENYITHRVTKIDGNMITTKGDANNTEDEPFYKDQVIGKVIHIVSNVGIWIDVFKTPKVIIAIIVAIILIKILFFMGK